MVDVNIYSESARRRIDKVVLDAERRQPQRPAKNRPMPFTMSRGAGFVWVIVREVPITVPKSLWIWVERAHEHDEYGEPGDNYGLFIGNGPPETVPEQGEGESDEDYAKRLQGWEKMATWPHTFADRYRLFRWLGDPTLETSILTAVRIGGAWRVDPMPHRLHLGELQAGTPVGDCRPQSG